MKATVKLFTSDGDTEKGFPIKLVINHQYTRKRGLSRVFKIQLIQYPHLFERSLVHSFRFIIKPTPGQRQQLTLFAHRKQSTFRVDQLKLLII